MGCIARSARSYHPARTLDEVDKQGRSDLPSVRFVRSVRDNIHRTCLRVFSEICVRFIISLFFLCKVTNPHKHHRKENRRKRHLRRKLSKFLTLFAFRPCRRSKDCTAHTTWRPSSRAASITFKKCLFRLMMLSLVLNCQLSSFLIQRPHWILLRRTVGTGHDDSRGHGQHDGEGDEEHPPVERDVVGIAL